MMCSSMCYFHTKRTVLFCVIFINVLFTGAEDHSLRESRKLFGGYRITPSHCESSANARHNSKGITVCMFNHECVQRGGEVVGACMDGFLFGACCQLNDTNDIHIPKGPGVVLHETNYYDEINESDQIAMWHDSFKPKIKPSNNKYTTENYNDINKDKNEIRTTNDDGLYSKTSYSHIKPTTESLSAEILSQGVSQITNSLLNTPSKESEIYYIKPAMNSSGHQTFSPITHGHAETVLFNKNGSNIDNDVRPSDFNVQISLMQTKLTPIVSTFTTSSSTTPKSVSTHKPVYSKPVFKPKPSKKPIQSTTTSRNEYILVQTITKTPQNPDVQLSSTTGLESIDSIIQMLNTSQVTVATESTPFNGTDAVETKTSETPITYSPLSSSTGYSSQNTSPFVSIVHSSTPFSTTLMPHRTSSVYNTHFSSRPSSEAVTELPKPIKINQYSTLPSTPNKSSTQRPPSTSYVYSPKPSKRPVTTSSNNLPSYENPPDNFASVTPTVIVLNGLNNPPSKPPVKAGITSTSSYEKVPQKNGNKKPVNQVTINNVISATSNIHVGSAGSPKPQTKPTSTVFITPKPTHGPNIITVSYSESPTYASASPVKFATEATTIQPELQTSPDDLINFPPVRNPNLNATGSNALIYINSTVSSDDFNSLPEVEFTTPSFLQEDQLLRNKMNLFVNKIVGSLQGTFQELHDIVILDKKPSNITLYKPTESNKYTTVKPVKKPVATTKKPLVTSKRPPVKVTTTRKPVRLSTTTRRTPTVTQTQTTRRPTTTITTTTRRTKPTRRATTTTTTAPSTVPTTTELQTVSEEVSTDEYQQEIDYTDTKLCGVRPLVKSGRIVGGKNAAFGEWPWQVLVRETTWLGLFTKNKCGGVLITNKFVTTAAHCQPGFLASLVAVFGEHDISGDFEKRRPVSRNVRRVVVNKLYDAATFENDLAILELDTPIHFDAHIVPICMPPDEADFTGRMATVTGWGRLKYGGGVPAILQEVQVPVIENSVCQEMFQTAGHNKVILNSFLCAGYANGQKDSCEGDSGGPLVLQRPDGRWQLVGTVSHGIKCASPYLPGVYMRTTFYKPWLTSVTGVH